MATKLTLKKKVAIPVWVEAGENPGEMVVRIHRVDREGVSKSIRISMNLFFECGRFFKITLTSDSFRHGGS